jgi:hypothetical protein
MAHYIDGKRVKLYWWVVLTAAKDAGVRFTLTSGNRTMAEQRELRRRYENGTGNLAAKPSPLAPHIRVGRQDHAIDVDSLNGGETRLQRWLESEGVKPTNPVAGESWHMELSLRQLTKLYLRYRASANYPNPARRWIREYDRLKRKNQRRDRRATLRIAMRREARKLTAAKHTKVRKSLEARSR